MPVRFLAAPVAVLLLATVTAFASTATALFSDRVGTAQVPDLAQPPADE
ncbi:hypothetical protein [Mycetocola zhujimingii]|nr:hypothetical protein [Mycetocola zhujimingii]